MRGMEMWTAERTPADLFHLLLKVLPGQRRLMLLAITDIAGGA